MDSGYRCLYKFDDVISQGSGCMACKRKGWNQARHALQGCHPSAPCHQVGAQTCLLINTVSRCSALITMCAVSKGQKQHFKFSARLRIAAVDRVCKCLVEHTPVTCLQHSLLYGKALLQPTQGRPLLSTTAADSNGGQLQPAAGSVEVRMAGRMRCVPRKDAQSVNRKSFGHEEE